MNDYDSGSEPREDEVNAERGLPPLKKNRRSKGVNTLALISIAVITAVSLVFVNGGFSSKEVKAEKQPRIIKSGLPPLHDIPVPSSPERDTSAPPVVAIEPPPVREPVPIQIPPPRVDRQERPEKKKITPEARKRMSSLLVAKGSSASSHYSASSNDGGGSPSTVPAGFFGGDRAEADSLDAKLAPTLLRGAQASIITNPAFMLTKGTFLDCVLETALSSDLPGMTACRLSRDVFSTNGKLLLLERGSKVVGEYQSSLSRGQARLFVLWTRIETPNGVIVNLDSPGTGPLGRSGLSGHIDRHFWERFGAAMLLSLVDDLGSFASSNTKGGGDNSIEFSSTTRASEDMASIVLKDTIGIKPTLIKHQGDHINIFVARDLDFRGVYDIDLIN